MVALVAAGLTVPLFVLAYRNPYNPQLPVVGDVLVMGVIVAAMPFGGVDDAALPLAALAVIGSLFNGVVWFGVAAALRSVHRRVRRARRSPPGENLA